MKKVLKLTLAVVCVMFSTSLFAQKIGRINSQDVVVNMTEFKEAQAETIQVEFNNKVQEYQKGLETMTDAVRQIKEKELSDMSARLQEFNQVAQQELQKKEQELMEPITKKAMEAINEVAKAGGYTVVFETGAMVYFDEAQVKDITPEVKTKLGAN